MDTTNNGGNFRTSKELCPPSFDTIDNIQELAALSMWLLWHIILRWEL